MTNFKIITKDLINIVNYTFGNNSPKLSEYYDGDQVLWFRKDNKLVYLDVYGKEDFYCSWDLLVDDSDIEFQTQGTEDKINTERVLEIMSEFFEIERVK